MSPPPAFDEIRSREDRHRSGVYPKRDIAIVRGEGSRLWDADGKEYLDLGANYGVANVGHCHPKVVAAIREQAGRLLYISPTFYNDVRADLLERLAAVSPKGLDRAFLCNSGTEALEAALKFARASTGRKGLVAFKRSYHGRTMGALSITWNPKYREPFEPLVPGVTFAGYGDIEAVKAAVTKETAAVVVEPVQGEGGIHAAPPGFLKALRDVATDAGALLVADEVQTGLGRTGRMFAVEHDGVTPDILCIAKSLAGGLPIGAMIAAEPALRIPKAGHGSTFSGNPLVAAAAIATLEVIVEERLPDRAAELGDRFMGGIRALKSPKVREVRGRGLMVGIELKLKVARHLNLLLERGIIALPAGNLVIRGLPPLVMTPAEVDRAVEAIGEVIAMDLAETVAGEE